MAAKRKQTEETTVSPYTLLNNWLLDNNKDSIIPEDLVNDKTIGPQYILYFFQGSIYQPFISNLFNNYGVFQLDRLEVFKLVKQAVRLSGFRQKYIKRFTESKTKLSKSLKSQYPYLKYDDVNLLVDKIEESDDRETIYEMLGLSVPKKVKTSKETLEEAEVLKTIKQEDVEVLEESTTYNWQDLLTNFELQEIY